MKLLPLIGALLVSTAPVQAFETFEELINACDASEENSTLCKYAGNYSAAMMTVTLLCDLEVKGRLTKENLVLTWDEWGAIMVGDTARPNPMWNAGAEKVLENLPECSIKPIP